MTVAGSVKAQSRAASNNGKLASSSSTPYRTLIQGFGGGRGHNPHRRLEREAGTLMSIHAGSGPHIDWQRLPGCQGCEDSE